MHEEVSKNAPICGGHLILLEDAGIIGLSALFPERNS
jgi:hypothetical protein